MRPPRHGRERDVQPVRPRAGEPDIFRPSRLDLTQRAETDVVRNRRVSPISIEGLPCAHIECSPKDVLAGRNRAQCSGCASMIGPPEYDPALRTFWTAASPNPSSRSAHRISGYTRFSTSPRCHAFPSPDCPAAVGLADCLPYDSLPSWRSSWQHAARG